MKTNVKHHVCLQMMTQNLQMLTPQIYFKSLENNQEAVEVLGKDVLSL